MLEMVLPMVQEIMNEQARKASYASYQNRVANEAYLADREHTEMREDTVYQRGVEDMRKSGLNPYTIGANPSPSSSSSVGADTITNKLELLGYILNLDKLTDRNVQTANGILGNILGFLKKK